MNLKSALLWALENLRQEPDPRYYITAWAKFRKNKIEALAALESEDNMAAWIPLIQVLVGGAAQLLESQKNKTAQEIGVDAQLADQVALAVLQKTAEVKGVSIDWTDLAAVAGYVQTLPIFAPIPDSPALTIDQLGGSKMQSPAADPAPGTAQ